MPFTFVRTDGPDEELDAPCDPPCGLPEKRAIGILGVAFGSVVIPLAATGAALGAQAAEPKQGAPLEGVHLELLDAEGIASRKVKVTIRDTEGRVLHASDLPLHKQYSVEAEVRGYAGRRATLTIDTRPIDSALIHLERAFLRASFPRSAAPADGTHVIALDLSSPDLSGEAPRVALEVLTSFGQTSGSFQVPQVAFETSAIGWVHPDDRLDFGPFKVERDLVRTIVAAADETNTDPVLMMAIADKESGFRPAVEAATSTAAGLYQFLEQTWLATISTAGHRFGLGKEADLIAFDPTSRSYQVIAPNAAPAEECRALSERLGRAINKAEEHLCQLIGVEDAATFIGALAADPNQNAAALLQSAAKSHPDLFYAPSKKKKRARSVGATYTKFLEVIGSKTERQRILALRADPRLSALLATELWKRDCGEIERAIGRSITKPETYLCHFMGVNGAVRFLSGLAANPDQSAAKLMPNAARANKPIYYEGSGRKRRARSVSQVYARLIEMMTTRFERYREVRSMVEAPLP